MHSIIPEFDIFLNKYEFKTLRFLADIFSRYKEFNHFSTSVLEAQIYDRNSNDKDFKFETHWETVYSQKNCEVHIGFQVTRKGRAVSDFSYYLCLIDGDVVLKKYHFDYTSNLTGETRNNPHPYFHLQSPGGLSPRLESIVDNEKYNNLRPGVEEPRLPYTPMSLAYLLHIALTDFPTDHSHKVIADGNWLKNIRRFEEQILLNYYERCQAIIKDKKSDPLIMCQYVS